MVKRTGIVVAIITVFAALLLGQELRYRLVPGWPQLPANWNLGETPGVDTDSRGHVYVFTRGPHSLLEFDPAGKFLREIGAGLFVSAHGVRIDAQQNIWAVDHDG